MTDKLELGIDEAKRVARLLLQLTYCQMEECQRLVKTADAKKTTPIITDAYEAAQTASEAVRSLKSMANYFSGNNYFEDLRQDACGTAFYAWRYVINLCGDKNRIDWWVESVLDIADRDLAGSELFLFNKLKAIIKEADESADAFYFGTAQSDPTPDDREQAQDAAEIANNLAEELFGEQALAAGGAV